MAKIQLNAVRREIANLEKLGIIKLADQDKIREDALNTSKSKYYQINEDSLLYEELRSLISKVQIIEEQELIDQIKEKAGDVKIFALSGVFTEDSDAQVDLFLVGKVKPVVVNRLLKKFEEVLGSPLRYTIMSEREFKERKELGDKFLYNIFESEIISIVDKLR